MTGDCHVRILWEPGGEIPPGHPTLRGREAAWLIRAHGVHVPGVHVPGARSAAQGRGAVHRVPARDQQGSPEENQRRGAVLAAAPLGQLRRTGDRETGQPENRGWMAYYGAFYPTALYPVLQRINTYLLRWIMKKYKKHSTWKKAIKVLADTAANRPRYFAHWAWVNPAAR